jgi:hypothetical protein
VLSCLFTFVRTRVYVSIYLNLTHLNQPHVLADDIPMAAFIDSPRTEHGDRTRNELDSAYDFSAEESFRAPPGDNIFGKQPNGTRTPVRNIAALRNANARAEFTPLMKSATANRTRQVNGLLKGGPATPAAMKPDFQIGATPLPEASTMDVLSSSFTETDVNRTPMPQQDSSDVSTPLALPRRGEGELDNGNGNVLTLREQEAVRYARLILHATQHTNWLPAPGAN